MHSCARFAHSRRWVRLTWTTLTELHKYAISSIQNYSVLNMRAQVDNIHQQFVSMFSSDSDGSCMSSHTHTHTHIFIVEIPRRNDIPHSGWAKMKAHKRAGHICALSSNCIRAQHSCTVSFPNRCDFHKIKTKAHNSPPNATARATNGV